MEKELQQSIDRVDQMLTKKLKGLKVNATREEMEELNSALELRMNLLAVRDTPEIDPEDVLHMLTGGAPPQEEPADQYEEEGLHIITVACKMIADLYKMIDMDKIKETNTQWLLEDCRGFMEFARESFGGRIPKLPNMVVSGPKKKKRGAKEHP